jgi:hypothetical protein
MDVAAYLKHECWRMRQRRILGIGSQCQALGNLPFLPEAARDLYAVMTDPERGGCVSAIEGDGLLINPTVNDAKEAIKSAYLRASTDEAPLFLSYIGHGECAGEDFYLLPRYGIAKFAEDFRAPLLFGPILALCLRLRT